MPVRDIVQTMYPEREDQNEHRYKVNQILASCPPTPVVLLFGRPSSPLLVFYDACRVGPVVIIPDLSNTHVNSVSVEEKTVRSRLNIVVLA
jgi:hypothetical protein